MLGTGGLCPVQLSLPGWMVLKYLLPCMGRAGHRDDSDRFCRVLSYQRTFRVGRDARVSWQVLGYWRSTQVLG